MNVYQDIDSLSRAAAERWVALAYENLKSRGSFHIALAGGSTPRKLYQLMATPEFAGQVDWASVHIYFSDERSVPASHPDSNFNMATKALLEHVPIPANNIHEMHADPDTIHEEAKDYEQILKENMPLSEDGFPIFDLVLLGMGTDGHTASLFPDTDILQCSNKSVAAVFVTKMQTWRLSMCFPVLNNARNIMILVAGTDKADIIGQVFSETATKTQYPIQMIQAHGELEWYLDEAAAQHILKG